MGQQFALIIASLVFAGGAVFFIYAVMRPERARRKIFEGFTGRSYGKDQQLQAPSRATSQMTAICSVIVFGALSIVFLILAIEHKDPATVAREKQKMDSYFREFHATRVRETAEKFLRDAQAGYPVNDVTGSPRSEQEAAEQPATAGESK